MKKQLIRLTEGDLHRVIKESVKRALKERRLEDSYPEVYDDEDYIDDSYPEHYDEYYGSEDPTYTAQKNDYNGIISMLHQYGITDAEISDSDPEGEYPPTLSFTVPPNNQEAEEIEHLVCSRGWRLMFVDPDEDNGGEIWTFGYEKDDYFDDDAYPDEYNDTTDRDLDADVYENTIRRAVRESLNRLIETDCAGVMQTGAGKVPKGTNPEAGQFPVPLGGDSETSDRHPGFSVDGKAKWNKKGGNTSVMRRPMYNPKSGKK